MGTVRSWARQRLERLRSWFTQNATPHGGTRYRARKPLPALITIAALAVVSALAWISVLNQEDPVSRSCAEAARSASASAGSPVVAVTPGERLTPQDLADAPLAPPHEVDVQVLNGNGMHGQASIVAGDLSRLGFAPTGQAQNDPVHPEFDLFCHGEIRFGYGGEAAARTLSLAVPCADLVRDSRFSSQVDLALGTDFINVRPNRAAHEALQRLNHLEEPLRGVGQQGGQAAGAPSAEIDPELLRAAYQARC